MRGGSSRIHLRTKKCKILIFPVVIFSFNMIEVIKKPLRTKNRFTPVSPETRCQNRFLMKGILGNLASKSKWVSITKEMAIALSP